MRRALALFLLLIFPSALLGEVLCSTEMAAGHDHGAGAMASVQQLDHEGHDHGAHDHGAHDHQGATEAGSETVPEPESSHPPVCLTLLTCGGGALASLGVHSFLPELGTEAAPLLAATHLAPASPAFEPPPPRS